MTMIETILEEKLKRIESMCLFEICNGYTGCSYLRSYVWASSEARAIEIFKGKYPRYSIGTIKRLLQADESEFITEHDDEGWGRKDSR